MFNPHLPGHRRTRPTEARLPEVAEPQSSRENRDSDSLDDLAAFKVFLKRNLRHEAPPADLLGNIRATIREFHPED